MKRKCQGENKGSRLTLYRGIANLCSKERTFKDNLKAGRQSTKKGSESGSSQGEVPSQDTVR